MVALTETILLPFCLEHPQYWLTYWSCFGILFLITDFIENFIGFIPGFYTLTIAATVYLMLPLFRGADTVSRRLLISCCRPLILLHCTKSTNLFTFVIPQNRFFAVFSCLLQVCKNCWFVVMQKKLNVKH